MEASAGGPVEHILYWTRVGNELPTNWREQKLAVAKQNLRGIIPDAIIVRVSTIDPDRNTAQIALETFIRALFASILPKNRPVFIT
jgi:EpsI family protein